jgi:hypothetical protein
MNKFKTIQSSKFGLKNHNYLLSSKLHLINKIDNDVLHKQPIENKLLFDDNEQIVKIDEIEPIICFDEPLTNSEQLQNNIIENHNFVFEEQNFDEYITNCEQLQNTDEINLSCKNENEITNLINDNETKLEIQNIYETNNTNLFNGTNPLLDKLGYRKQFKISKSKSLAWT